MTDSFILNTPVQKFEIVQRGSTHVTINPVIQKITVSERAPATITVTAPLNGGGGGSSAELDAIPDLTLIFENQLI